MMAETSNINGEIELDSKKLQVGEKTYYVDVKENEKGRFIKLVEGLGHGKMSRIVVSVLIANEFVDKLKEINDYIINNPKIDIAETPDQQSSLDNAAENYPSIIHSSHLFVQNRRFYFDLREHKDGYRRLRISYVLKTKRINLSIVTDAIPSLLLVLEDYVVRFAPDPTMPDITQLKIDDDTNTRHKPRSRHTSTKDDQTTTKPPKKGSLIVSETPVPVQQPIVNKTYSLEVVTGEQNSFIRMTELIGHSKKSTFHVPLEGCVAWKDAIVEFVNQITPEDISKASAIRHAAESSIQPPKTI